MQPVATSGGVGSQPLSPAAGCPGHAPQPPTSHGVDSFAEEDVSGCDDPMDLTATDVATGMATIPAAVSQPQLGCQNDLHRIALSRGKPQNVGGF